MKVILVLVFSISVVNGLSGAGVGLHSLKMPMKDMTTCLQEAQKAENELKKKLSGSPGIITVATSCLQSQ